MRLKKYLPRMTSPLPKMKNHPVRLRINYGIKIKEKGRVSDKHFTTLDPLTGGDDQWDNEIISHNPGNWEKVALNS